MDKPLWGLKVLKFDGAIAPRVLRFDAPLARGLWWRLYIYKRRPLMIKPLQPGFRPRKNKQTGLRPRECVSSFGDERSKPMTGMLIMPYGTESKSRNADFISIALRAIHNPRANGPSNLRTLRPIGPVHLKNPFPQPFYTTRRRQAAITFGPEGR